MTASESFPSELRVRSVRLVRRARQGVSFFPTGLLVLFGGAVLAAGLTLYGGGAVEDAVSRASHQALERAGATWARVEVSGQWVTLRGAPPTAADAAEAFNVVEQARAPTLFGAAQPVRLVEARFSSAVDPHAEPSPGAEPSAAASAEDCGAALRETLSGARIEFPTGSEIIGAENRPALDAIAEAVAGCDGTLRIEGHTDNSGSATFNEELSRRRAEAVRTALVERGLPAERMVVEELGASRPIASNLTKEGRERNRRIEFRILSQAD